MENYQEFNQTEQNEGKQFDDTPNYDETRIFKCEDCREHTIRLQGRKTLNQKNESIKVIGTG